MSTLRCQCEVGVEREVTTCNLFVCPAAVRAVQVTIAGRELLNPLLVRAEAAKHLCVYKQLLDDIHIVSFARWVPRRVNSRFGKLHVLALESRTPIIAHLRATALSKHIPVADVIK